MNRVLFLPEVRQYVKDLVPLLYRTEYFSYLEKSQQYVRELIDDIITNLPRKRHKPAPAYFDRYGKNMQYAGFRKTNRQHGTSFFTTYRVNNKTVYLVRYISNNHVIAQHL
ncbi:MAG: hypothetical protein LBE91_09430 [Tannerella sp.]|jgi:hypothetical protein|nr:hypothetical protein [Tannerella sp.]